ncbi:MAG TPA: flagellin lysine-N-methylase, partial [Polyangiaceae bacterium]|nr:flagellin lysine-N-methylase [Polyangiaceae bacterium]
PHFGRLRLDASGHCGMLDDAGLCGIHTRLGPDALSDVCTTYPRYFNEVDGELELFGTVSCPELARLLLFGDEPLALERAEHQDTPRKLRNQFRTEQPYYQPFLLVRGAFNRLLEQPGQTLSEKLFALLWISEKLSGVVHARASTIPSAELGNALGAMLAPEAQSGLVGSYRTLKLDGSLAVAVITSALSEKATAGDAAVAFRDYTELCARVAPEVRQRVDACLTRYAQNHLYTTPYMLYGSLFAYARDLTWRVATLRYLLHKALTGFDGNRNAVDRQIVEVVYKFARRVEHSELFAQLGQLLRDQHLDSFAHTLSFLSV